MREGVEGKREASDWFGAWSRSSHRETSTHRQRRQRRHCWSPGEEEAGIANTLSRSARSVSFIWRERKALSRAVVGSDGGMAQNDADRVLSALADLNPLFNFNNSVLSPTSRIESLGYVVDMTAMTFELTPSLARQVSGGG